MIDWEKVAEDRAPCYFWLFKNYDDKIAGNLRCFYGKNLIHPFEALDGFKYHNCELILDSDKEKYTIKETEYRACENWEEFKFFFGKMAKMKNLDNYETISNVYFPESSKYWFEHWELIEPINGSKIIGVRV